MQEFAGGTDGAVPSIGGLLNVNGVLYGTTLYGGGGKENYGDGTVYRFRP